MADLSALAEKFGGTTAVDLDSLAAAHGGVTTEAERPRSSNLSVVVNAANKGIAAIPDMLLNAPNTVLNLGRAGVGTIANAAGRPDLAPDLVPNPDLARRAMETIGAINPGIVPQGLIQKGIDVATQGAVGGALTGGAGLPRVLGGAALGALSAGSAGATEAATGNPAWGAVAGLAVPGMVSRIGGSANPQVQALADEGARLTMGQIKGGVLQRMEDAATSFPILGDAIKAAQRRGHVSFDRAALNRSLEPIGDELPKGLVGNKAVEYAYRKLGDAYESLLPNLTGDLFTRIAPPPRNALPSRAGQTAPAPSPSLLEELDGIRAMAQQLPEPQSGQVGRVIDREIVGRFTQSGRASGETLKDIESKLGQITKDAAQSKDYDVRTFGDAVQEMRAALRRMVDKVNPDYAGELAKINEGYANFKIVQNAAGRVGANEGVFTPAQLHSAVRAKDASKDKARFAEGNALMQDLSTAGKSVLSPTVPDSGTPLRLLALQTIRHPLVAIPAAAASLPYTSIGQDATQALLLRNTERSRNVSNRVSPIATANALQAPQTASEYRAKFNAEPPTIGTKDGFEKHPSGEGYIDSRDGHYYIKG